MRSVELGCEARGGGRCDFAVGAASNLFYEGRVLGRLYAVYM